MPDPVVPVSSGVSSEGLDESLGAGLVRRRPDLARLMSPAQHRVLELLLSGLTEPQIADKLGRSKHTVHDHVKAIYATLGVSGRVPLVLLFSSPPKASGPQG